jgi:hypothetical protein
MNFNDMCNPMFDVIIHYEITQHTEYGGVVLQSTSNHRTDTKVVISLYNTFSNTHFDVHFEKKHLKYM